MTNEEIASIVAKFHGINVTNAARNLRVVRDVLISTELAIEAARPDSCFSCLRFYARLRGEENRSMHAHKLGRVGKYNGLCAACDDWENG